MIDSEGIGPPICIACESLMEIQPDWSPAGDKIIYTRGVYNFEPINIWIMNPDGSGKEQLTTGKGDTAPQWSPNGTKIAFSRKPGRYEGYNQVCVMDSDGKNIQEHTSGNFNSSAPTWSPDGNYIAYVSDEGSTLPPGDLWVMKANGREKQRLTNIGGVAFPKWSPTANIIAFQRHSGMNCDIDIYLAYLSITEETIEVGLDIKPGSWPNPINTKSRGVLPAAILGSADFDVSQVDIASIRLAGVAPIRSSIDDVATPFEPLAGKGDADDCIDMGPDGYLDLLLKFNTQEIVAALGDLADGDILVLTLTGNLKEEFGGTQIQSEDVVIAKKKPEK